MCACVSAQAEAIKSDLKYIYCGVCRKMVEISFHKSSELLEKRFKHKKKHKHEAVEYDGEGAVQDFVEKIWCMDRLPFRQRPFAEPDGRIAATSLSWFLTCEPGGFEHGDCVSSFQL